MNTALLFVLAVLLGITALATVSASNRKNDRALERLERKIDLIVEHLGIDTVPPGLEEVTSLLVAGKKIEAVKVYRRLTGVGLKEAVRAVERIAP